MKKTKAIENKRKSLCDMGKDAGMTCLCNMFAILNHVALCLFISGGDYVLQTSPDHLKYPNHCMNPEPNIVLSNSVNPGDFLDRSSLLKMALSQAPLAVSLLNNFVFL